MRTQEKPLGGTGGKRMRLERKEGQAGIGAGTGEVGGEGDLEEGLEGEGEEGMTGRQGMIGRPGKAGK